MDAVEARVKNVIVEYLDIDLEKVKNESSLKEDLKFDSLDIVELLMSFEEEFGVEIPEEEAEKILTVQQAIDAIFAKLQ
ncbi:MAG: acyl carrier protein [Candidatus Gracilibacteria bacterium]|nr:acyl carrier protein [Candidatus Gracilibacteria bacterium]